MLVRFQTPVPDSQGMSFNGRTAGLHPADESSILSISTNSEGKQLRSMRRAENPDKNVRLVPLPPNVARAGMVQRRVVAPEFRDSSSLGHPILSAGRQGG
jgi:hypothetical protein